MPSDAAATWDRISAWYQREARSTTDAVQYLDSGPTDSELRLCGDVSGRRVLDLGCGGGQNAIAFARAGARVIGVDHSNAQLAHARGLAEEAEVRVELHLGDVAELAFLTPASVDLAFSACALDYVEDLGRVFRQVHRVLKPDAPLVFSITHPAARVAPPGSEHPAGMSRSYFDRTPIERVWDGVTVIEYAHPIGEVFAALQRAHFRVDALVEPQPTPAWESSVRWQPSWALLPPLLVVRARKLGL